eukprot:CAMPEP_0170527742 /NCGR_PEP_ID=MMETSP0209-20121228/13212_1 /TAXON_ID=665100 ORGANISM="Litonotus pictus, Strain P1" /NCGR_SAMPLE_ID=MMETSP0209 /ASSEMBLY_ACC=CAM_ASM_000301 /LENGTH=1409 /DNA_ID=CAMNT_0010818475 /DNA_START=216 /DNA_END=4445 /DNA_ORIENTATION=+
MEGHEIAESNNKSDLMAKNIQENTKDVIDLTSEFSKTEELFSNTECNNETSNNTSNIFTDLSSLDNNSKASSSHPIIQIEKPKIKRPIVVKPKPIIKPLKAEKAFSNPFTETPNSNDINPFNSENKDISTPSNEKTNNLWDTEIDFNHLSQIKVNSSNKPKPIIQKKKSPFIKTASANDTIKKSEDNAENIFEGEVKEAVILNNETEKKEEPQEKPLFMDHSISNQTEDNTKNTMSCKETKQTHDINNDNILNESPLVMQNTNITENDIIKDTANENLKMEEESNTIKSGNKNSEEDNSLHSNTNIDNSNQNNLEKYIEKAEFSNINNEEREETINIQNNNDKNCPNQPDTDKINIDSALVNLGPEKFIKEIDRPSSSIHQFSTPEQTSYLNQENLLNLDNEGESDDPLNNNRNLLEYNKNYKDNYQNFYSKPNVFDNGSLKLDMEEEMSQDQQSKKTSQKPSSLKTEITSPLKSNPRQAALNNLETNFFQGEKANEAIYNFNNVTKGFLLNNNNSISNINEYTDLLISVGHNYGKQTFRKELHSKIWENCNERFMSEVYSPCSFSDSQGTVNNIMSISDKFLQYSTHQNKSNTTFLDSTVSLFLINNYFNILKLVNDYYIEIRSNNNNPEKGNKVNLLKNIQELKKKELLWNYFNIKNNMKNVINATKLKTINTNNFSASTDNTHKEDVKNTSNPPKTSSLFNSILSKGFTQTLVDCMFEMNMENLITISLFGSKDDLFNMVKIYFDNNNHLKNSELYILFMIKQGNTSLLVKDCSKFINDNFMKILIILFENQESFFSEELIKKFLSSILKKKYKFSLSVIMISKILIGEFSPLEDGFDFSLEGLKNQSLTEELIDNLRDYLEDIKEELNSSGIVLKFLNHCSFEKLFYTETFVYLTLLNVEKTGGVVSHLSKLASNNKTLNENNNIQSIKSSIVQLNDLLDELYEKIGFYAIWIKFQYLVLRKIDNSNSNKRLEDGQLAERVLENFSQFGRMINSNRPMKQTIIEFLQSYKDNINFESSKSNTHPIEVPTSSSLENTSFGNEQDKWNPMEAPKRDNNNMNLIEVSPINNKNSHSKVVYPYDLSHNQFEQSVKSSDSMTIDTNKNNRIEAENIKDKEVEKKEETAKKVDSVKQKVENTKKIDNISSSLTSKSTIKPTNDSKQKPGSSFFLNALGYITDKVAIINAKEEEVPENKSDFYYNKELDKYVIRGQVYDENPPKIEEIKEVPLKLPPKKVISQSEGKQEDELLLNSTNQNTIKPPPKKFSVPPVSANKLAKAPQPIVKKIPEYEVEDPSNEMNEDIIKSNVNNSNDSTLHKSDGSSNTEDNSKRKELTAEGLFNDEAISNNVEDKKSLTPFNNNSVKQSNPFAQTSKVSNPFGNPGPNTTTNKKLPNPKIKPQQKYAKMFNN